MTAEDISIWIPKSMLFSLSWETLALELSLEIGGILCLKFGFLAPIPDTAKISGKGRKESSWDQRTLEAQTFQVGTDPGSGMASSEF